MIERADAMWLAEHWGDFDNVEVKNHNPSRIREELRAPSSSTGVRLSR